MDKRQLIESFTELAKQSHDAFATMARMGRQKAMEESAAGNHELADRLNAWADKTEEMGTRREREVLADALDLWKEEGESSN